MTGREVSSMPVYLIPIALASWKLGTSWRWALVLLSSVGWLALNVRADAGVASTLWNFASHAAAFAAIAALVGAVRLALDHERELSRTDYLSGALNTRAFYEVCERELQRAERYDRPLSLAYIDLDNFKSLNDQQGHAAGDEAIRLIAEAMTHHLRRVDVVARLGGDEFAVIMPETADLEARLVLRRLVESLGETMRERDWPVTFSVGVITCTDCIPHSADALINKADALMYEAKRKGKNRILHACA